MLLGNQGLKIRVSDLGIQDRGSGNVKCLWCRQFGPLYDYVWGGAGLRNRYWLKMSVRYRQKYGLWAH